MTQETVKELLRKTKVIRDNFYHEPIEPEHEDELKITFEFLSEVINYLENDTDKLSAEKLQEQLNNAKEYIEHVIGTIKHDGHLGTIQTDLIFPDLEKALAAIGGDK
ncbi:hypothetical protein AJ89_03105 [Lactococcus cremoris subsp. cremoris IBB477]|uniref:Uncharacterized protein n=1 Tax=Lactococcus cremoris subsp. cremoris IBB477 TaxID=1449093 RepID=A0A1E7G616_LACLC|nr:hypothetical protein [Lactococcus cremoris]OEU40387.1 hypothetical protein AJ89_03105 [Lactococcus cremoris subsp. cremoris IBB477]